MLQSILAYEVNPGGNVPEGLPRQFLVVLSPIWRGPVLDIEYPDGGTETLEGRTVNGEPCDVQVFWTRKDLRGPAVCLAIGGDAGLRTLIRGGVGQTFRGLAFLALAASLIPPEILAVIGPPPGEPALLLG
jgi:hypothetical protein